MKDGPASDSPANDGPANDGPANDGPANDGLANYGPESDGSIIYPVNDTPATDGPENDKESFSYRPYLYLISFKNSKDVKKFKSIMFRAKTVESNK